MKIIAAKRGLAISALLGEIAAPIVLGSAVTHRKGPPKIGAVAVVRADDLLAERVGPEGPTFFKFNRG